MQADIFFVYSFDNPLVNKNLDWIFFDKNNESERYTMKKYYNFIPGLFVINTPIDYITKVIHKLEKSTNYMDSRS